MTGGRVPIDTTGAAPRDYKLIEQTGAPASYARTILRGVQAATPLSTAFFSQKNITIINNAIRYAVWVRTKQKELIGPQSEVDLVIIMRAIYLQNAQYGYNITQEIVSLNNRVVQDAVSKIITGIQQHRGYLRDISNPINPMDRAVNVNSCGTKSLSMMPRV